MKSLIHYDVGDAVPLLAVLGIYGNILLGIYMMIM